MKIKISIYMRKLTTWATKEVFGIITLEIRVIILEMQVKVMEGKDNMIGQKVTNREIGRHRWLHE